MTDELVKRLNEEWEKSPMLGCNFCGVTFKGSHECDYEKLKNRVQELERHNLEYFGMFGKQRKEIAHLREALEFYADEEKWDEVNVSTNPWNPYYVRDIHSDSGDIARHALSGERHGD